MPRFTASLLVALACLLPAFSACRLPAEDRSGLDRRFQRELEALHEQYRFPGATAAYALPDGTVRSFAVGMADVERDVQMTPETRMLAASIGKTFVGAVALALQKEGVLCLDDHVSRWLGDRPWFHRVPNASRITLRQLLMHTSGLPNHVEDKEFARALQEHWREPGERFSPEGCIGFILDEPALFPPGEGWSYSDTGYLLAGLVMQEAADQTYYALVQRLYLEPLLLTDTTPSNRRDLPDLAAGYMAADNDLGLPSKTVGPDGVMLWDPGMEWTGGGMATTSADLVRWAAALFGGRAMDGPYLEEFLRSVPVHPEAKDTRYALGIGIHTNGPHGPTYGHGGWIPGYSSSLRYYVDGGFAVAFQINTDIGILDDSTPLFEQMERRLADVVHCAGREHRRTPSACHGGQHP